MGVGGEPEGRWRLPRRPKFCEGHSRGPRFIWRFLSFFGAAVALQFVAWVSILAPRMSLESIDALIKKLTWVSGMFTGITFGALPIVLGLAIAAGVPSGKDSYCHMAKFGLALGSALCARLLGVEFEIF